ncbi:MAG TPA: hypothetical protein VN132_08325 [Bdellovibrio sp.]|nr:hypothetical protein [Bdellovibrio sp.]
MRFSFKLSLIFLCGFSLKAVACPKDWKGESLHGICVGDRVYHPQFGLGEQKEFADEGVIVTAINKITGKVTVKPKEGAKKEIAADELFVGGDVCAKKKTKTVCVNESVFAEVKPSLDRKNRAAAAQSGARVFAVNPSTNSVMVVSNYDNGRSTVVLKAEEIYLKAKQGERYCLENKSKESLCVGQTVYSSTPEKIIVAYASPGKDKIDYGDGAKILWINEDARKVLVVSNYNDKANGTYSVDQLSKDYNKLYPFNNPAVVPAMSKDVKALH